MKKIQDKIHYDYEYVCSSYFVINFDCKKYFIYNLLTNSIYLINIIKMYI